MTQRLQIWGRANSVNVQKLLWCCDELGLEFERIDAGLQFGRIDTPAYHRLNPNRRIPTLVDGDFVLWESHAIIRYLTLKQSQASDRGLPLYPSHPANRASIERWLDWALGTLQPVERVLFQGMVRTPEPERDMAAISAAATAAGNLWHILDQHLTHGGNFIDGDDFTLADLVLGTYARRWFGVVVNDRPALERLERWYDQIATRRGFLTHVAPPLS